jgi:beta-fructofuranosidase
MLSLPRELTLSADNRLQMRPAREVESLRGAWFPWPISTLNNQQMTLVEHCDAMEVILQWDCANSSAEQYGIRLGDGLRLYVDAQMQRLVLERDYPQYGLCGTRSVALNLNNALNLRLFFDCSSVEVFVNEGRRASAAVYILMPTAASWRYLPGREGIAYSWRGVAAGVNLHIVKSPIQMG